jgi:hypothetical protein
VVCSSRVNGFAAAATGTGTMVVRPGVDDRSTWKVVGSGHVWDITSGRGGAVTLRRLAA